MVLNKSFKTRDGQELPLNIKVKIFTTNFIHELGVQTCVRSNEYVNDTIEVFESLLPPEETARLDELVRQNILRASIRLGVSRAAITEVVELAYQKDVVSIQDFKQTPKTGEFIERNPWLIDKLNSMRNIHQLPTKAIEEMKKEFLKWLESFENFGLRRGTAPLHALIFRYNFESDKYGCSGSSHIPNVTLINYFLTLTIW